MLAKPKRTPTTDIPKCRPIHFVVGAWPTPACGLPLVSLRLNQPLKPTHPPTHPPARGCQRLAGAGPGFVDPPRGLPRRRSAPELRYHRGIHGDASRAGGSGERRGLGLRSRLASANGLEKLCEPQNMVTLSGWVVFS